MGFLDNSTITVDAILTKRGRQILSQGGNFNITKFALSDEEVDYTLYDVTHPNGSDSYGAVIENMSLLEAASNRTNFNSFLVNASLAGATVEVGQLTYTNQNANTLITISPTTIGAPAENYVFTIVNTNIVKFETNPTATTITANSAIIRTQTFGDPTPNATTVITVVGKESGISNIITITVNATAGGSGSAESPRDLPEFLN